MNPKLAEIDIALTALEPTLSEFGRAHGFNLVRSHEGSFNIPRRWLHRHLGGIFHEIGLIISIPMPERLERGFFPTIPCSLYITGVDRKTGRHYHHFILDGYPFERLTDSLPTHLGDALEKLDRCTIDFLS